MKSDLKLSICHILKITGAGITASCAGGLLASCGVPAGKDFKNLNKYPGNECII
jgi:hypothetical protein